MHLWNGPVGPLGGPFTLSPEDFSAWKTGGGRDNYFLGYSLDEVCSKVPSIPFNDRPRRVFMIAEELKLLRENDYVLNDGTGAKGEIPHPEFYNRLSQQKNVIFMGQLNRKDVPITVKPPDGITLIPVRSPKSELRRLLANSRVALGVGHPRLSPSPYEALCLGVPFINPVHGWNRDHPDDRSRWSSQHDALVAYDIDEPYVYHVKKGDTVALELALAKALDTPIERRAFVTLFQLFTLTLPKDLFLLA
jgi:hypothetical protein